MLDGTGDARPRLLKASPSAGFFANGNFAIR